MRQIGRYHDSAHAALETIQNLRDSCATLAAAFAALEQLVTRRVTRNGLLLCIVMWFVSLAGFTISVDCRPRLACCRYRLDLVALRLQAAQVRNHRWRVIRVHAQPFVPLSCPQK